MIDPDDDNRSSDTVDLAREPPTATPTPSRPRPTPLVVEYAQRPPANQAATVALVAGLLLFVPFVSGLLAVAFGRRGLRTARDVGGAGRGRARVGVVLGCINLAGSVLLTVSLSLLHVRRARAAEMMACMSQSRQIGQATYMYAAANRGALPPSFDALVAGGYARPTVFVCPAYARDHSKPIGAAPFGPCSYVYARPGETLRRTRPNMVLAYEPTGDHADLGTAFLFCDGSVRMMPTAQAQQMIAELTAGQNPPHSLVPAASSARPGAATIRPATRPASNPMMSTSRPGGGT